MKQKRLMADPMITKDPENMKEVKMDKCISNYRPYVFKKII